MRKNWNTLLKVCIALALLLPLGITLGQNAAADTPKTIEVYRSQFDKAVRFDVWSEARGGRAPNGTRLLGLFGVDDTLYQTLGELPDHRYIRLRFDLIVAISWDGNDENWGPDTWYATVKGGPLLAYTTFCNRRKLVDPVRIARGDAARQPKEQSFPDEFPAGTHPANTGGDPGGDALGFKFPHDHLVTKDSLYKMEFVFPHTGENLVIQYGAFIDSNRSDEGWAINNMVVEVIEGETTQGDEQLTALWSQLSGKDPVAATQALWNLGAAGPAAVAFVDKEYDKFLRGSKEAIAPEAQARFDAILEGLAADAFGERQKAERELQELGVDSLDLIVERLQQAMDPEIRRALNAAAIKLRVRLQKEGAHIHKTLVGSRVSRLKRIFECHANGYTITSSTDGQEFPENPIGAAADGLVPNLSSARNAPRFMWEEGGEQWLQYEFPEPKTISGTEVFWCDPRRGSLPDSWKVVYKAEDGSWKPFEHKGDYATATDEMNRVMFQPVRTGAVRLVAELPEGESGGVFEFRMLEPEGTP